MKGDKTVHLLRRLIAAILSALIMSTSFEILDFVFANPYQFSFLDIFMIAIIYISPIFILFGIPVSLLIDWFTKKVLSKLNSSKKIHLVQLFIYAIFGVISLGILFSFVFMVPGLVWNALFGIIPAVLYFFVLSSLKKRDKSTS